MPDAEPSFTINEFCQLERICRATYYNLQHSGLGPDEILVGTHRRITADARRRWHRKRERAAKRVRRAETEAAP
jgi:hypothetical protein